MKTEYNIISKYPKGNKPGELYNVEYQVNGLPEIHTATMICIVIEGKYKYAFIDDKYSNGELIVNDNTKNRNKFIQELAEFQKGSSYRKSHPIVYSIVDTLKKQLNELQEQSNELQQQILNKQNELMNARTKEITDKIDIKSLDAFINKVNKVNNDKQYRIISPVNAKGNLFIFDMQMKRFIAKVICEDGKIGYEIKQTTI